VRFDEARGSTLNIAFSSGFNFFKAGIRETVGSIVGFKVNEPLVALTFDDGPDPQFTPRLVDILETHQARATFFMVGEAAQKYPELVRRVAQGGHAIGIHSWDHPSFPLISGRERRRQIRISAQVLAPYGQKIFRPPYGDLSFAAHLDLIFQGYQVILWNKVVRDWMVDDVDALADELICNIEPGCIFLLHDSLYHTTEQRFADRSPVLDAVEQLLTQSGERYRFVTIPELLQRGRPIRANLYQKPTVEYLNALQTREGEVSRQYHP
jgi:peptidoglycan/xylan/chitin deacetylase (PgdA/CDA1 family)